MHVEVNLIAANTPATSAPGIQTFRDNNTSEVCLNNSLSILRFAIISHSYQNPRKTP